MKRILTAMILMMFSTLTQAVLKIEITEGVEGSLPIAVVPFKWSGGARLADADVSAIISSDLARSGRFAPLPAQDLVAYPHRPEDVHFKSWRMVGVDHLVIGGVQVDAAGRYQVQFRLFDILKGEQVVGYSFNAERNTLRSVAHRISDLIINSLTGLGSAFDARIAYVTSQKGSDGNMVYRLQVADTDGFNPQTLLKSSEPVMSPSWSPDAKKVAYVSFEQGKPEIYVHDIHTAKRELVSTFAGINGAPVWSPDGTKLALTLSKDGNPDIYILNLRSKALKQLTKHWSIDTEAAWMPDGQSLVFTSSRSGKPQLYQVPASGREKPRRLTFEGTYNANPSVSSDGSKISFVQGNNNVFSVAVLHLESGLVQTLTAGPLDESPEFAPNGSMILYASRQKGQSVLAAVSVDGRHKQRLVLSDGQVREPAWSNAIH